MRALWKRVAAVAAFAGLMQSHAASAQQTCISDTEMGAMAVYAVPSIVQSVNLRCSGRLDTGGWLAQNGARFSSRYAALKPSVWPRAKAGILKYLGQSTGPDGRNLAMLSNLPDQHVQPLVDALIVQEVSPRIEPGNCRTVERVLQALAPVDPEVAGTLIGLAANFIARDEPVVCSLEE